MASANQLREQDMNFSQLQRHNCSACIGQFNEILEFSKFETPIKEIRAPAAVTEDGVCVSKKGI